MFGRKSLPVGAILIILVIALAALGLGYALWSETLFIHGDVTTGSVDMEFSPCETNDPGDSIDPGWWKNVASCECVLSGPDGDSKTDTGPDHMLITILNGYPYYACQITYDMTNVGSIPVHLEEITEAYDPEALEYVQNCWDENKEPVELGYQLHPGKHVWCTIDLAVKQEAEESTTYTLDKEYFWVQYNESSFPPPSGPEVNPGAPTWTKAAGVRYKGYNTGGEIFLGPMLPPSALPRAEAGYNEFQTVGSKTYQITFSHDAGENKISTSITSPDGSVVFDFDDSGAPGCSSADWDAMEILVRDSMTDSGAALQNVMLDSYPLGNFGTVDKAGTPGWQNWTVTNFDFSQSFVVTADLVVDGYNGNESIKVEFNVGCLP